MNVPKQFEWVAKLGSPKLVMFAITLYGTCERLPDGSDNPMLLRWAKICGLKDYTRTSIPWCGLFMAYVCKMVGWPVPEWPLGAVNWLKFGRKVSVAMFGDVLVFKRPGGHHVGIYIGKDALFYYVLAGNQGDKVCILRVARKRCIGIRRPPYEIQPNTVVVRKLDGGVPVSTNEG